MKTYEVNIKLKRNRQVTLYLSPNKDEDIFVDEKASGVPFQLIEGKMQVMPNNTKMVSHPNMGVIGTMGTG